MELFVFYSIWLYKPKRKKKERHPHSNTEASYSFHNIAQHKITKHNLTYLCRKPFNVHFWVTQNQLFIWHLFCILRLFLEVLRTSVGSLVHFSLWNMSSFLRTGKLLWNLMPAAKPFSSLCFSWRQLRLTPHHLKGERRRVSFQSALPQLQNIELHFWRRYRFSINNVFLKYKSPWWRVRIYFIVVLFGSRYFPVCGFQFKRRRRSRDQVLKKERSAASRESNLPGSFQNQISSFSLIYSLPGRASARISRKCRRRPEVKQSDNIMKSPQFRWSLYSFNEAAALVCRA